MMHLETTCHASHVTWQVSHVTFNLSQTERSRDLQFSHHIPYTRCANVTCQVSHIRYQMSGVTCHLSLAMCHV